MGGSATWHKITKAIEVMRATEPDGGWRIEALRAAILSPRLSPEEKYKGQWR